MFILDENEKDTFIHKGGADEWKENYLKQIQLKAKAITPQNITEWIGEAYSLEKELVNPLHIGSRFVTGTFPYTDIQQSGDFMKMICDLKSGTKLYIGGMVDFHYQRRLTMLINPYCKESGRDFSLLL